MISLAFLLKPYCPSLINIILYLYLHKLATTLIWTLIGCLPYLLFTRRQSYLIPGNSSEAAYKVMRTADRIYTF